MTPNARQPVLFVGHGSPMNAIEDNAWSRGFRALAARLPRPRAILAISAHWWIDGTFLTGNELPETIHDFGGFPEELYQIEYPAPGDVALAENVAARLADRRASLRLDWGLDHGTWSVLRHVYPEHDVPVVQLSIDRRLPPADQFAIGQALAPLRDEGVLIFGTGNIVHNLSHALGVGWRGGTPTPPWAAAFDADVARALEQHDAAFLVRALSTADGRMAHPTPDHYQPLLYAFGAADDRDAVQFPIAGFAYSSLSMRAAIFGG